MDLDKLDWRDDLKWSHPQLETMYGQMGGDIGYASVGLNDKLSDEERKKWADDTNEQLNALIPPMDPEYTRYFDVHGCPEEPDAPVFKLTVSIPKKPRTKRKNSAILIIPGGGLCLCMGATSPTEVFANRYGVPVATFEYRTVIDAPYPAALNDCFAAFLCLQEHAEELNINPDKIVLHGNSSGGHLSLALPHRLKKHGITCRGSVVWAPIIDDRPMYYSSKVESVLWGNGSAALSARQYLGDLCGSSHVPPEAMPGRATPEECVGLSPVFIHAMTEDTGLSAALHYCDTLSHAGVYNECHAWGGTNHLALSMNSLYGDLDNDESDYTKAFQAVLDHEFEDLFRYDLRRPWVKDMVEGTEADAE